MVYSGPDRGGKKIYLSSSRINAMKISLDQIHRAVEEPSEPVNPSCDLT